MNHWAQSPTPEENEKEWRVFKSGSCSWGGWGCPGLTSFVASGEKEFGSEARLRPEQSASEGELGVSVLWVVIKG